MPTEELRIRNMDTELRKKFRIATLHAAMDKRRAFVGPYALCEPGSCGQDYFPSIVCFLKISQAQPHAPTKPITYEIVKRAPLEFQEGPFSCNTLCNRP